MSDKELSIFESTSVEIPAYLAAVTNGESNIDVGKSTPSLSIRGKVFRTVIDGEETPLMRYDKENKEDVPISTLPMIVLNQGPFGARVYFASNYDSANLSGPACFSADGITPDKQAVEPQAKTCAVCPHAVKGSKISASGTATTACQLQRRLAVVPANKPDFTPMLLRLAPTSAFDPETKNSQSGWFGWRQYMDFLSARGIKHTAQVVTKMRFDATAEHPKLLFRPERFLTEEEAKIVAEQIQSDDVAVLLEPSKEGTVKAEAIAHVPGAAILPTEEDEDVAPQEAEAPKAAKPERKVASKSAAKKEPAKGIDELLDDWDA